MSEPIDPAMEAVANQIIDNLIEKLQGISQNAGYQISCKVEEANPRGNTTAENKIVVDIEKLGPNPVVGESNRDHFRMIVNLYCLAPASNTATTSARKRMIRMYAAVWHCLRDGLAHTLGNLARDTVPDGDFGMWQTTPALVIPLTITFDTKQDNPFER